MDRRNLERHGITAFELSNRLGIEVDLVLDDMQVAIAAKASERVTRDHLNRLRDLSEDHPKIRRRIVACREPRARRTDDGIEILPVKTFVRKLWEEGPNGPRGPQPDPSPSTHPSAISDE